MSRRDQGRVVAHRGPAGASRAAGRGWGRIPVARSERRLCVSARRRPAKRSGFGLHLPWDCSEKTFSVLSPSARVMAGSSRRRNEGVPRGPGVRHTSGLEDRHCPFRASWAACEAAHARFVRTVSLPARIGSPAVRSCWIEGNRPLRRGSIT